jgi:hypothetical protein
VRSIHRLSLLQIHILAYRPDLLRVTTTVGDMTSAARPSPRTISSHEVRHPFYIAAYSMKQVGQNERIITTSIAGTGFHVMDHFDNQDAIASVKELVLSLHLAQRGGRVHHTGPHAGYIYTIFNDDAVRGGVVVEDGAGSRKTYNLKSKSPTVHGGKSKLEEYQGAFDSLFEHIEKQTGHGFEAIAPYLQCIVYEDGSEPAYNHQDGTVSFRAVIITITDHRMTEFLCYPEKTDDESGEELLKRAWILAADDDAEFRSHPCPRPGAGIFFNTNNIHRATQDPTISPDCPRIVVFVPFKTGDKDGDPVFNSEQWFASINRLANEGSSSSLRAQHMATRGAWVQSQQQQHQQQQQQAPSSREGHEQGQQGTPQAVSDL